MNDKNPLPSNIDILNVLKNSNLTPSQKVSVITEINNKNQPSKNLSHVPCKFFRQGACQAGNSCPFSHANDISLDSQPCKYFQKGNCKFGVKCALSHVLPDGRKINTKTLQSVHQQHKINNNNNSSPSNKNIEPVVTNDLSFASAQINPNSYQQQYHNILNYNNNQKQNYNYEYNYNYNNTNNNTNLSSPSSVQVYPTMPVGDQLMATSPFNNTSIWSSSSSNQFNNNNNNNNHASHQFIKSMSFSGSNNVNLHKNINVNNTSSNSSSFIQHNYSTIVDSAILDSDDDDSNELNDDTEDVDFIPSSLNDLLTPQELKRRNSRPSFVSQNPMLHLSNVKEIYNLVEEETPFIMD